MNNILTLTIPGIPQPKQSMRSNIVYGKGGKPVTYIDKHTGKERILQVQHTDEKVVMNENNIRAIALSQLPRGFIPFDKGVRIVKLHYVFPILKGMSDKLKNSIYLGAIVHKTTKPDLTDNLNKGLFDALQGIVFINDSQICEMNNVKKYYGVTPCIILELEHLENLELPVRSKQEEPLLSFS